MENNIIAVPRNVLDSGTQFVEVSSILIKRATDELSVRHAAEKKAEAIAPSVLKNMLALGVVPKEHEKSAEVMLGAHDTTLQLLDAASNRIHEYEVKLAELTQELAKEKRGGDLGQPEPTSRMPSSGSADPYSQLVRESDKPLLSLIGK